MNTKYKLLKTFGSDSWEFQLFQSSQQTIENLYFKYPSDPQISQEYARRSSVATHDNGEISLEFLILIISRYPNDVEMNRLYQKRKLDQKVNYKPLKFYTYCAALPVALALSKIFPSEVSSTIAMGIMSIGTLGIIFNLDYHLNKDRFKI